MSKSKALRTFKNQLNPILGLLGLKISNRRIVNTHQDDLASAIRRFEGLRKTDIQEIEGLYRDYVFKDLPGDDETRSDLMVDLLGTGIGEAFHILHFLHQSMCLPGDVCEFGVAQGSTSAFIAHEIRATDKTLWLFDSFEGLPRPSAQDVLIDDIANLGSMDAYQGTMDCDVSMVRQRLRRIDFPESRVRIIPGFIEETVLQPHLPTEVCFAYVDFDFYEPILVALDFLDRVLLPGGFLVVDDYGYFSAGAKTAVDEFVETVGGRYALSLPIDSAGHFCVLEKLD